MYMFTFKKQNNCLSTYRMWQEWVHVQSFSYYCAQPRQSSGQQPALT